MIEMANRFVAIKDEDITDVLGSLDRLGIKYDYFGHNDIWSVVKMYGFSGVSSNQRTYDNALKIVGVVEE